LLDCIHIHPQVDFVTFGVRSWVKTDPEKIKAVVDWPRPETIHDLRSFLGLCTYYRRFVKNFSTIARPLHKLTEAKSNFIWTEECEKSFNSLKQALTSSPILTYPRTDKDFILDTDASNEGIGAVLSQNIGNEERVIAYFSKSLGKPERNYCVTRKELLAIVKSIEHFHHYLYGRKFLLRTDHASLRWLLNFKEPEGQIARWIQRLQEYDFEIQHRKGTSHENADALSRRPCTESCKHCTNAEKKLGMEIDISVKVLTTASVDPWSSCEIQKAQLEDPNIKPILEKKLNSADRPSWQEIAPESPATKRYWALWDSLHLKDGVLYRRWESDNGSSCRWQLILPKSRIPEVLRETHDSASGGHFGVMKTLSKTRERFYWDRLRADVEKWCRAEFLKLCSAEHLVLRRTIPSAPRRASQIFRFDDKISVLWSAEEDRGVTAAVQAGFSDESLTADATELLDLELSNKLHSSTSSDTSSTI
ncbi:Transposon Ty3-G Gag-Pol polyprotein, partial [Araneus ventricosus]